MLSKQDRLLLVAAEQANLHSTAMALAFGANVDAQDTKGNTALHWSVFHNQQNLIRLLLGCGARLIKNKDFETPLNWAIKLGSTNFIHLFNERSLYS